MLCGLLCVICGAWCVLCIAWCVCVCVGYCMTWVARRVLWVVWHDVFVVWCMCCMLCTAGVACHVLCDVRCVTCYAWCVADILM